MIFSQTSVSGAWLVDVEMIADERGGFGRVFCADEFGRRGLATSFVQSSISRNPRARTLRGMHYQAAPHGETKLLRCTRGAVFDVLLDLRRDSATYRAWYGAELSAENGRALYVPPGVAHGFVTLVDHTDVFYEMDVPFRSDAALGVRWDDPAFAVDWPVKPLMMSDRDRTFPNFVG